MNHLPSLNALRAFHAVARLQSVSEAARELAVTPGAVSRQIKNLEEDVGVTLFTRKGSGMHLTEDGRALENGLSDAFMQIAEAVERLRQPVRGERLRVAVPPVFASAWLIPRLVRFNALRPGTEIIVIDRVETTVVSSGCELLIGWGFFEDDATMTVERLTESEEVFPVCAPQACAGDGLAGATLLHYEPVASGLNWPDWSTYLQAVGLDETGTRDGPRFTPGLLIDAVRRGKGVMLTNTTVSHDDLASGRLMRPVAESMPIDACYWLLTATHARNRPEVLAFRGWLKEELDVCSAGRP